MYDGKFIFGGYDLSYAAKDLGSGDIFWADMYPNYYYWVVSMGSVKFLPKKKKNDDDKEPKPFQLEIQSKFAVLDTGMSLALIPKKDFIEMKTYLILEHGLKFTVENNM